ncbi:palmitoyltransferase ZDHHC4 [Triplophysa dalaica]|uniref:palmitoyltransferase ZDHHC4 n=1 Tax=Triplophysa dalaica TaxID=1582913 RepID=UPI0024DFF210|nr:palmitoyltransferase ZDHHC4 [Triplophysa dalaica]XP_056627236.1 palmitoyltransferase ZDHHC4 [Triplophysa dalaica]
MDFLTLFGVYVVVVLTCIALVCKYSGHQQTPLGRLFDSVTRVVSPWIPQCVQSICYRAMHILFHQRNNFFLYMHLLLEIAVYTEFSYEIFGFCLDMGTSLISLCVPYILLALKSYVFYLCCSRDPGTLTKENHTAQLKVYQYDEKLFQKGIRCPTCDLVKPARSKHCRVCNRCVQRFDHHCVWVNNCIGAQNTRYFLLYLLSVCAAAGDISVLIADMLVQTVVRTGLLHAHYLDEQGQQQPVGPLFIIQHLFLTFPRIVFMLGFLVFVFFLLAGYSMFHMYLALVNQTSNEWFKGKGHSCQHCYPHSGHRCRTSYNPFRGFHHRGILKNLGEIFWPLCPVVKKDN